MEQGFLSLSASILHRIISQLDLKTISGLSQTCRVLSRVTRSESLWRKISKALIGPWIHRPHLLSTRLPKSEQPQNPPLPPDWTADPKCFPVSHFVQIALSKNLPNSQSHNGCIPSWYHFATRFLIPNFHLLGWHISNKAPSCELFLVTYDIFSGRIVLGEVKTRNKYAPIHDQPVDPSLIGLPSWVTADRIQLEPDGQKYTILHGPDTPDQKIAYEIFAPVYVHDPSTAITPVLPRYAFVNQTQETKIEEIPNVPQKTYLWEDFERNKGLPKLRHADKILASRTDIRLRTVLSKENKDLTNSLGDGPEQLPSFTLGKGPDRRNFFPIKGPISSDDDPNKGIDACLWVGVNSIGEGVHQVEFGKIVEERQCNSYQQLRFLRLTGGRPEYIWDVGVRHGRPLQALDLQTALVGDFNNMASGGAEFGWLQGQGKVEGINPWKAIQVQFINDEEAELNEININQIRVKWSTDSRVTSYYKVQFD